MAGVGAVGRRSFWCVVFVADGSFSITTKDISHYGYSSYDPPTFGSKFKPKCRHGACDVVWTDVGLKQLHAVLQETHGRYHGTYRGSFLSSCRGTRSTTDVEIDFKVTKARAMAGDWAATKFEGTLEHAGVSGRVRLRRRSPTAADLLLEW